MAKKKKAEIKKKKDADVAKENDETIVPKAIENKEEKTLVWFFVIVGIVFISVLIPYFWVESSKVFEFNGVDFVIEEYAEPVGEVFHGRFISLTNPNLNYNVFFRTDPRENNVEVVGKIDNFWSHEAISWSPEVEACRGDLSRAMLDLGAFLRQGVGAVVIETGFTDEELANSRNKDILTCDDAISKTVVIVDLGERRIVQDEVNPNCYTIYAGDCEDSAVIEKFIMQSVVDFRE